MQYGIANGSIAPDIDPKLVRREVYELPDGGTYTTGWTEVIE